MAAPPSSSKNGDTSLYFSHTPSDRVTVLADTMTSSRIEGKTQSRKGSREGSKVCRETSEAEAGKVEPTQAESSVLESRVATGSPAL